MANVTINSSSYEGITLQVGRDNALYNGTISFVTTVIQSFKYRINGGSFNFVYSNSVNNNISLSGIGTSLEILTLEIVFIDGGLLSNIVQLKTSNNAFIIITTADLNKFVSLNVIELNSYNSNIIGNISELSPILTHLRIPNSLNGNISDFNNNVTYLYILNCSNNKIKTIPINSFPTNLKYFYTDVALGNFTFIGTSANFPTSLETFGGVIDGAITMNLDTLPVTMTTLAFNNAGSPLVSLIGSLANLPSTMAILQGYSLYSISITGNLNNLPAGMKTLALFSTSDTNTITGNIADLPPIMQILSIGGNNTISGNLNNIGSHNIYIFNVLGNNTITGLIQDWPKPYANLTIIGANTISGDLGLCNSLNSIIIQGNNTISDFTSPQSYAFVNSNSFRFIIEGLNTLSSTEVDNILIALAAVLTTNVKVTISILGNSMPRTSASDAAYTYLKTTKDYNITLNT